MNFKKIEKSNSGEDVFLLRSIAKLFKDNLLSEEKPVNDSVTPSTQERNGQNANSHY